jgi:guanylate kinase
MDEGKLIILCAPSGSGKTTLAKFLLKQNFNLGFSISATSRQSRSGEIDGKDYYFLSLKDFKNKIKNEEFLEYEEVYDGIYYGTLRSELNRLWSLGLNILFDIDVQGGINLKNILPKKSLSIFIQPPSIKILKKRLKKRNTESEKNISLRISKAKEELSYSNKFDLVIINKDLMEAEKKLKNAVLSFIKKTI